MMSEKERERNQITRNSKLNDFRFKIQMIVKYTKSFFNFEKLQPFFLSVSFYIEGGHLASDSSKNF